MLNSFDTCGLEYYFGSWEQEKRSEVDDRSCWEQEKKVDVDGGRWLRFTFDTGAAVTAFPRNCRGVCIGPGVNVSYKTASGEVIPDVGGCLVHGWSEMGEPVRLKGRKANIHKALVSAGAVHRTGRCTWLEKRGGWIMKEDGYLANQIKQLIRRYIDDGGKDVIPLYEENGVYTGYVDREAGGRTLYTGYVDREGWRLGGRTEPCPLSEDPAYTGMQNSMPWWERGQGAPHRQS